MSLPPMTAQLARRIEQSDIDYSISRLEGMRLAKGNPLGVEVRNFGTATTLSIRGWPDFWYGNKVVGVQPSCEPYLDDIQKFFREQDLSFRFEIMPGDLNSALATHLHKLGLCQMDFNTAVYGLPADAAKVSPKGQAEVRQVRPDEVDLFIDLYQDGFGLPRLEPEERTAVRSWLERAHTELYLCIAHINSAPAGVGVLYIKDGTGLLADASTLPAFRGQGCHAAMIQHRIAHAAEANCDLLTSFIEFGSASHRNLERAGLRVAYCKAMWWPAG